MPHKLPTHKASLPFKQRRANKEFYNSTVWKRARLMYLSRHPICEDCGKVAATEVHHEIPVSADKSKALNPNHYKALCASCHSKRTAKRQ